MLAWYLPCLRDWHAASWEHPCHWLQAVRHRFQLLLLHRLRSLRLLLRLSRLQVLLHRFRHCVHRQPHSKRFCLSVQLLLGVSLCLHVQRRKSVSTRNA
jgi:hypothetical protein